MKKELKQIKFEKVVKRYNELMDSLGLEHKTIGTKLSEDTDNWNIRDMVAEADYQLSCYYENGHVLCDQKQEIPKIWRSETGKLKRFINAYLPYIHGMKTTCRHCSKYD